MLLIKSLSASSRFGVVISQLLKDSLRNSLIAAGLPTPATLRFISLQRRLLISEVQEKPQLYALKASPLPRRASRSSLFFWSTAARTSGNGVP